MYSQDLLKLLGIRLANELIKPVDSAEQKLWRAVVVTAFEDCRNTSGTKAESYKKQEAHEWFMRQDQDFQAVCFNAGLDPDLVQHTYIALVETGKIKFTKLQKEWCKYKMNYQIYRESDTKEQRKLVKNNIERIKKRILKLK